MDKIAISVLDAEINELYIFIKQSFLVSNFVDSNLLKLNVFEEELCSEWGFTVTRYKEEILRFAGIDNCDVDQWKGRFILFGKRYKNIRKVIEDTQYTVNLLNSIDNDGFIRETLNKYTLIQ